MMKILILVTYVAFKVDVSDSVSDISVKLSSHMAYRLRKLFLFIFSPRVTNSRANSRNKNGLKSNTPNIRTGRIICTVYNQKVEHRIANSLLTKY